MSAPYSKQRNREQQEAEARFSNACNYAWRTPAALAEAIAGNFDFKRLAEICILSTKDEAEAGRRLRRLTIEAVHEWARYEAEASEEIPPVEGWRETRPVSALPLVASMFSDRLGAVANQDGSTQRHADGGEAEEPARLRETGAI